MVATRTADLANALAIAIAADIPVLLWGAPGSGKTSTVVAAGVAAGRHVETVIASLHEPVDFSGLPIAQADGSVRFAEPGWARRLADAATGLLFLDEVSLATPAVQAALLRVVLDRQVGERLLGDRVAVVAAANPTDQASGAFELSPPLVNRFCHLDWKLDVDTVVAGFCGSWPTVDPHVVPDGWEALVPAAKARIGAFIDRRRDLAHQVPDVDADQRGWPSPRSWEQSARVLAACRAAGSSDVVRRLLVAGLVGEGPAIELLTWLEQADLPDTVDVLDDPTGVVLPTRSDALWAVLASVTAVATDQPERWTDAIAVCIRVAATNEDLAVRAARLLAGCRPADAAVPTGIGALRDVLTLAGVRLAA